MKTALLAFLLLACSSVRAADVWGIPPTAVGTTIIKSMTWYGTWAKYSRFASASGNEYNSAVSIFDAINAGATGSPPTGTINYSMKRAANGSWLFEKAYPYRLEYGMAINYGGTQYYTMFGWIAAVKKPTNTDPPQPAQQGVFDSNNQPMDNAGRPVDYEGDPIIPAQEHKASPNIKNPFSYPATPTLTLTDAQGQPMLDPVTGQPMTHKGPTLQPGQAANFQLSSDQPFGYSITWDFGDGLTSPGGNGYSAPAGGTPPAKSTIGQTTPVSTPGLTIPAAGADATAATNRVADILKLYGDDAKTARNIANNSLDALKKFAGDIKDKLTENNTLEGEAVDKLGEIATNTEGNSGGGTAPEPDAPPQSPQVPDLENAGQDNKLLEMAGIKSDMAAIGNSLAGLIGSLGLSASYGSSPWVFNFNTRWGTFAFDVEGSAGWFMDVFRALVLGIFSLHYVWRLITTIRGAMVS